MRLTKKHALKALAAKELAWLTPRLLKISSSKLAHKRIFSTAPNINPSTLLNLEEHQEADDLSLQLKDYCKFLAQSSEALNSHFLTRWFCLSLRKELDKRSQDVHKALQKLDHEIEKRRKSRFSYVPDFDTPSSSPLKAPIALYLTLRTKEAALDYLASISLLQTPVHLFVRTSNLAEITTLLEQEEKKFDQIHLQRISSQPSLKSLLDYDAVAFLNESEELTHFNRNQRRFLIHHVLGSEAVLSHAIQQFESSDDAVQALVPPAYHATHHPPPDSEALLKVEIPSHGNFWLKGQTLRDLAQIDPVFDSRPALEFYKKLKETILTFDSRIDVMRCPVNFDVTNFIDEQRCLKQILRRIQNPEPPNPYGLGSAKIAVVRCLMGNTEPVLRQQHYQPEVEYYFITDEPTVIAPSPYQTILLNLRESCPRKRARYVKTHLLELFPQHAFIIWLDANLIFTGYATDYAQELRASGADLSVPFHSWRNDYTQEMDECLRLGISNVRKTQAQKSQYEAIEGLKSLPLRETGFMVLNAQSPKLKTFYNLWWQQIQEFELRDQFSFNFAEFHSGIRVHSLLPLGYNLRNHRHFALAKHNFDPFLNLKIQEALHTNASKPNSFI